MKAAIYYRVSTDEQGREGVSMDNQLNKCRLQAELAEMEIVAEVSDYAKSAKSIQGRDGLQSIIELVKSKKVKAVIIYKLDRISRNVGDLNYLVTLFNKYGVSLISVRDSIDTQSAAGRMVINLLGSLAQWERETISERTGDALQHLKRSGKRYSKHTPFGMRQTGSEIIPDIAESELIVKMQEMRMAGASYPRIAMFANSSGLKPREGGEFFHYSVRKILLRVQQEQKAA